MTKRPVENQKKMFYLPQTLSTMEQVGEQIRLARLRRGYTVNLIADRAGVSRQTVWKVEKGSPSVAIGVYAKVLAAIGLQQDLLLIARDDELGHLIQDAELDTRKRK